MSDLPSRIASFLAELRRRRVIRVALAYGAVGWALIEVADLVVRRLTLPDWTATLTLVMVLLGFPIALLLGWAYDITPDGIRDADAEPASDEAGRTPVGGDAAQPGASAAGASTEGAGRRPVAALVGAAVLVGLVGLGAYSRFGGDRAVPADETTAATPAAAGIRSIAVLPFADLSPERDQQYFADGLAEELLNVLAQVDELHVAARTSSFAFRGEERDVRGIADTLGVATVLDGSVRKWEDRVRISAQLVDAETGYHLWSDSFERELDDVFAIQDEIARTIVDTLRIAFGAGATLGAGAGRTEDVRAHDLYLLGLHEWHRRGDDALRRGADYFRQAVAIDSTYAKAWAGLSLTYAVLPLYGDFPVVEAVERGRAAALRALEVEPALPEAHAALGQIAQNFEWDWAEAERRYRRALELNPNYATAHQWLGEVLAIAGRTEESVEQARHAVDLAPITPATHNILATTQVVAGDYERAIERFHRVLELDSDFELLRRPLPIAYMQIGAWDSVGSAIERFLAPGADPEAVRTWTSAAAAVAAGERLPPERRRAALDAAETVIRAAGGGTLTSILMFMPIREDERALDAMERAYADRVWALPWYVSYPIVDPVRDDPRFAEVAGRLGLEWPPSD